MKTKIIKFGFLLFRLEPANLVLICMGNYIYRNKDGKLPMVDGRIWYEADINYTGGMRNSSRILYSNDGLVFVTYNHYFTFNQICQEIIKLKNITIDFSLCRYPIDLHNQIKEKLELPEWYGNNLDALWDMLTGFIETPVKINVIFKPEYEYAENLRESVLKIIETFKEASQDDEEIEFNCEL